MVLNEWIFHDLRGDNGPNAQLNVRSFLLALKEGPDHIVVLRGSPWSNKAFDIMKIGSPPVRILSQLLHLGILRDPLKCRYVEEHEVSPLPPVLAEQVPNDDAYLFQTALAVN